MKIIQGPLPNDYESVNPSTFLAAWINGTTVYELGPAEFKGGTLQFVVSSTDPPALADRFPGMLWFKRGEGRLFIWDYTDDPCGPSSANTNDVNWMSLSDRRDIWIQTVDAGPPGSIFFPAATPSGPYFHTLNPTGMSSATFDPYMGRVLFTAGLFATSSTATGIRGQRTTAVQWINLDTAISGGKCRAVEWGFCDIYVGCGATSTYGPLTWDVMATDVRWGIPRGNTSWSGAGNPAAGIGKWSYFGHLNNPAAGATAYTAGAPYTRPGFKWALSFWEPTGGT